jgi:polygalacturonase
VRRCTFRGHYALCIGSEMSGGAHDIYAQSNSSAHSVRMGFYIKGGRNRGGIVSDVFVRDLQLNEVTREVVRLIPNYDNDRTSPYPSKFHNIVIENMTVRKAGMGIRVFGWPDATIDDVTLRGIIVGEFADGPALEYNNVNRLVLEGVQIGGRDVSGTYDRADPSIPVPR